MSRHTKASRRAAFRRANTIPTPPVAMEETVRRIVESAPKGGGA